MSGTDERSTDTFWLFEWFLSVYIGIYIILIQIEFFR